MFYTLYLPTISLVVSFTIRINSFNPSIKSKYKFWTILWTCQLVVTICIIYIFYYHLLISDRLRKDSVVVIVQRRTLDHYLPITKKSRICYRWLTHMLHRVYDKTLFSNIYSDINLHCLVHYYLCYLSTYSHRWYSTEYEPR